MKSPFKGRVALVVEDDWFVREDIANQFRQEGWMVIEAATGSKALDVLRELGGIDVLVTDIRLAEEMTGWDVAEAVRASRPKIPVISSSGNPDNNGRRVPESIFLNKPVTPRELILACHRLLPSRNS